MLCDRCKKDMDRNVLIIEDYANGTRRLQHHRLCQSCYDLFFDIIENNFYDTSTDDNSQESDDKVTIKLPIQIDKFQIGGHEVEKQ